MKNLPTPIDPIKDVVDSLVGGVLVEVQHMYLMYMYVSLVTEKQRN